MKKQKNEMRNQIRHELKLMTDSFYKQKCKEIHDILFSTDEWKAATTIGITISIFPEVDTYEIIKRAWSEHKQVGAVKCVVDTKGLQFYQLVTFQQLEKGFYNLYEPIPERTRELSYHEIDLLFVPGIAFTKEGFRLGQGGGYYDRFLEKYQGNTLSLAFESQIKPQLPIEEHDYQVNTIITERGVYS